jgi:putative membrane protein
MYIKGFVETSGLFRKIQGHHSSMTRSSYTIPLLLLGLYGFVFAACAISPYDRSVWWAENIPVLVIVTLLIWISRGHRFSNTSYVLMTVFIVLHTIGGHFTFERVPFGAVSEFFGFERNHFDRVAHFSVGFYAYPIAEYLMVKRLVRSRWIVALFPLFAIVTVAGVYEIIEWQYALNSDPAAGNAVLGSQGDIWDAQKDILADTLGAMLVLLLFFFRHRDTLRTESNRSV